jgi:uncharacterized protein YeaO (DUF488 family)
MFVYEIIIWEWILNELLWVLTIFQKVMYHVRHTNGSGIMIRIKRAYQSPAKKDGYRIMVDRVWPRGVSKQRLKMDVWLKDIAPSHDLRRWLSQNSQKWDEFAIKYREELADKTEFLNQILELEEEKGTVTLVYTNGNIEQKNAIILKEVLKELNP